MKLLSCHVENFGKLSNKDYEFSSNITCFLEENGAGKTTLASFIKAMFYGLESYKINSTDFCDRQRFYPFDGGNFGGNLTFKRGDNVYKIERFFGEKSQTQDTLLVYKNGDITTEFGLDVGKSIFGIDKQSFERTAFITSDEIEIKSTSSINSKLSGFLQGGGNDLDVDDAVLSLEKLAKEYKKSNRGRDKITEISEEISILNEKIANVEAISKALDGKYRTLNDYKNKIDNLTEKSNVIQHQSQVLSEWEYYERVELQILEEENRSSIIKQKYGGLLPTYLEVENYNENVITLCELSAKTDGGLSPDESARLFRLEKAFAVGVPTREEMLSVQSDIDGFSTLSAKLSLESESDLSVSDKAVVNTFSNNPPSQNKLIELDVAVQDYKANKKEYDSLGNFTSSNTGAKNSAIYGVMAIFAFILAVIGVIFINSVLGIPLTVAGGLLLLLAGFLYLSEKAGKNARPENPKKLKLELELRALEDKIKSNILPYGYFSGNGVLYDYATFVSDCQRFYEINAQINSKTEIQENLRVQIQNLNAKLTSFFAKYGLSGDNFLSNLTRLQSGIDELYSLKKRVESATLSSAKIEGQISKVKSEINAFLQKYDIQAVTPSQVLADVKSYDTLISSINKLKITLQEYKKEKNLTEKPEAISESLDDINKALREYQREYSALKHQIMEDEYAVDRLDGYYIDKQTAENQLDDYKQKYKLLTSATSFLLLAEQNLKDKYVKPVKDEFIKYANLLEKILGEKITMTKNFEIRFERAGKERPEKHLSSGIKSICAFCFRIAMIKNMYKDLMPFLLLDDPFVNLDEEHLEKVRAVIKELSSDMQIVYFTCHASRKV